jgi:uncharacterized membrane-anchored protein
MTGLLMAKRFPKYFLAMALPLTVLLVRPLTPAAVLTFGQEIRLSTEPADPRDLFRGDYVTLNFSIERLGKDLLAETDWQAITKASALKAKAHEAHAYVLLEPDKDEIWRAVNITAQPPASGVYLRAHLGGDTNIGGAELALDYGDYLKRYYVRENTGRDLEDAARRGELVAVAKVWRGRVVLTSLEERRGGSGSN